MYVVCSMLVEHCGIIRHESLDAFYVWVKGEQIMETVFCVIIDIFSNSWFWILGRMLSGRAWTSQDFCLTDYSLKITGWSRNG